MSTNTRAVSLTTAELIAKLRKEIWEINRKIDNSRRWRKYDRVKRLEAEVAPLRRQLARLQLGTPRVDGRYD